jgi:ferritin-like metal-binding protein YciE
MSNYEVKVISMSETIYNQQIKDAVLHGAKIGAKTALEKYLEIKDNSRYISVSAFAKEIGKCKKTVIAWIKDEKIEHKPTPKGYLIDWHHFQLKGMSE